jgi:hypothetical protein
MADPVTLAVLATVGLNILDRVGGMFGGPSPTEQAAKQQVGIGRELIPQLQAQAAGKPSAATLAGERRLETMMGRMGQSYAASARRQGIAGTPVAMAQQGRLQAAHVGALGELYGGAQQGAQQTLAGLYTGGMQMAGQLEMQKKMEQRQMFQDIGTIVGMWQQEKQTGATDARFQEMMTGFQDIMSRMMGQLESFDAPAPAVAPLAQPSSPAYPGGSFERVY